MPKRQNTYYSDRSLSVLGEGASDNYSGRVNDALDRYGLLIESVRLDRLYTDEERLAICRACWSTAYNVPADLLRGAVLADVEDSYPDELGLSDAAKSALLVKLRGASTLEQIALVEYVERTRSARTDS